MKRIEHPTSPPQSISLRPRASRHANPRALLAAALLAGCASSSPPLEPAATTPPTDGPAPAAPAAPAPVPAHATVLRVQAKTGVWVGIPCADGALECGVGQRAAAGRMNVSEAAPATATLVAKWTASTPLAANLQVYLYGPLVNDQAKAVARGKGPSPVTFEVPVASLVPGTYAVDAFPGVPGATNAEDVAYDLTLAYKATT